MTEPIERPEIVTDEMLEYLDELRELGIINMFGSQPYLIADFELTKGEALEVFMYWMNSFGERHPRK